MTAAAGLRSTRGSAGPGNAFLAAIWANKYLSVCPLRIRGEVCGGRRLNGGHSFPPAGWLATILTMPVHDDSWNANMKAILFLTLFMIGGSACAADARPNVLFLAVDDMNDWIGCLETTPCALTPNIDRLAARGVCFTNAHTAGVFCAPSRAAIFSGQFASTTGCYQTPNYFVHHPEIEPLQACFSKAGYQTFGAGKLFHHPAGSIDVRGWDEFFLRRASQRKNGWPLDSWSDDTPFPSPFPKSVFNRGRQVTGGLFLEWGPLSNEQEEELADTKRVNWAVQKLQEQHDKPFFLGVGIYAPHFPNYCPQRYFDLYDAAEIELPPYRDDDLEDLPPKIKKAKLARSRIHKKLEALGALEEAIRGYLACISYADAMIGRVLDALEASPYADNTIVVLWSDHGYHHGEKGDWGKHTLWERTSNVPFIWAGPGIVQGKKSEVTVSLIDMYPTFVEQCNLEPPRQHLEGQSLAKTLADPDSGKDRNVLLPYLEPGEYAVINRQWRYIRYGDDGEELYDVQADPHEWVNLAHDTGYADRMRELRRAAPQTFAAPEPKLNVAKDLFLQGDSFVWKKGHGNAGSRPPYLPPQELGFEVQGKNLIANGSFENDPKNGSIWAYRDGVFERSRKQKADGTFSLVVADIRQRERSVRQTVPLVPQHRYASRFKIYFEPGSEGKVVFDTSDRFDETAQIVMDATVGGGWQEFQSFFNSGDHSAVTIRFFPIDGFAGKFYVDEVQLFEAVE